MGVFDYFSKFNPPLSYLSHRNFFLLGLAVLLCGLCWSNFLMSLGQFILLGNWLLEFRFLEKWQSLKSNTTLFPIVGLFVLHAIGLLWSTDMNYGTKDLTTKLPLLSIPIILATSESLNRKEWKALLQVYWISALIITGVSLMKYLAIGFEPVVDKRELSVYISHIRYGLNLSFLIVLLLFFKDLYHNPLAKFSLYLSVVWLILALVLFELITGLACLFIAAALRLAVFVFRKKNRKVYKLAFVTGFVGLFFLLFIQIKSIYKEYHTPIQLEYDQYALVDTTENGSPYIHKLDSRKENGVLIYHYFAYNELRREWKKVSDLDYKTEDYKGNALYYTLLRYMSSKGLKKDSLGFSKMTSTDIKAVENGIANVYYTTHNPLQNRIYQTIYEIDQWQQHGAINGYSLIMRFEYWQTAWNIIQKHPIIGVGTGDVKQKMKAQYVIDDSRLEEQFRKRAHNQYLTFWLALGIPGLLIFLLMLCYPFKNNHHPLLYGLFVIILAVSCLMEDTFETQAGITFSILFYALILFGLKAKPKPQDNA